MQILSLSETIDGSLRDAMGQGKEWNDSGSVHQPFLGRISSNIVALGGLLLMGAALCFALKEAHRLLVASSMMDFS